MSKNLLFTKDKEFPKLELSLSKSTGYIVMTMFLVGLDGKILKDYVDIDRDYIEMRNASLKCFYIRKDSSYYNETEEFLINNPYITIRTFSNYIPSKNKIQTRYKPSSTSVVYVVRALLEFDDVDGNHYEIYSPTRERNVRGY